MNLSASSIIGTTVKNEKDEKLGKIEELMIDLDTGAVSYAVLSFGGFLGMGDKLFAVPLQVMRVDTANKEFKLHESKERLKDAPGFNKDHWPDTADAKWRESVHRYYGL